MSQSLSEVQCPVKVYQDELFLSFKETFQQCLAQKKICNFDQLMNNCLNLAGIDNYQESSLDYFKKWFNDIYNLEYLKTYIENCNLNEIIIHENGKIQTIGKDSTSSETSLTREQLQLSYEVLCQKNQVQWNYSYPFASFHSVLFNAPVRVTLTHFSCSAIKESKIFIRKHQQVPFALNMFTQSDDNQKFLLDIVTERKNILITGPTGSGKTSLLKSLIDFIPKKEHIICIEDTYEIFPRSSFHTTLLADGSPGKTLKDYCSYAMRMSPDRIILGEIRSHEVVPFLLSLNTGHKGMMASTHANCAKEGLERLALLYSMYTSNGDLKYDTILELLSRNINYVVHLENKEIKEVIKVFGSEKSCILYETIIKH